MQNDTCYFVRILSRTDGKQSIFTADGNLFLGEQEIGLTYRQDGCEVQITATENCVRMKREGNCYVSLCFCPKETTKGEIGLSAEQAGEVDVYTNDLKIWLKESADGEKKLKIELDYTLAFSQEQTQHTFLSLIAEKQ